MIDQKCIEIIKRRISEQFDNYSPSMTIEEKMSSLIKQELLLDVLSEILSNENNFTAKL